MRIDELHKFSDGTLDDVRTALNDRLKGIRMEYLPQTFWSQRDKANARAMIQAIDKRLKTRRIMRSLERFVGGRPYGVLRIILMIVLDIRVNSFTMKMEILLEPTSNKLMVGRSSRIRRLCKNGGGELFKVVKVMNFKKYATLRTFQDGSEMSVRSHKSTVESFKMAKRIYAWFMISEGSRAQFDIEKVAVRSSLRSLKPKRTIESRAKKSSISLIRTLFHITCSLHNVKKGIIIRVLRIILVVLPEHPSDTYVFTMKMEILLESTSSKLMVGKLGDSDVHTLEDPTLILEILSRRFFLRLNLPNHRSVLTGYGGSSKDGDGDTSFQTSRSKNNQAFKIKKGMSMSVQLSQEQDGETPQDDD
ncbi:hypothetical protein Tco_0710280 [Tanacetum coccineum]